MTAEIVTLYRGHSIYSRDGGTIKLRGRTLYTGTGSMLASQAMIDLLIGPRTWDAPSFDQPGDNHGPA